MDELEKLTRAIARDLLATDGNQEIVAMDSDFSQKLLYELLRFQNTLNEDNS